MITPHLIRRDAPKQTGPSKQTVVIIAVSVGVGGIVLLYVLLRLLRSYASPRRTPLPPIQPLALHRERDAARPAAYPETSQITPPATSLNSSRVSLIGRERKYRAPSTIGHASDAISLSSPPMHPHLPLPGHFLGASTNGSQSEYSFDSGAQDSASPSPSASPHAKYHSTSSDMSHSANKPRTRAPSISSTGHGSVRYMPHNRHSQVQIVLPTPLAFEPQLKRQASVTSNRRMSFHHDGAPSSSVDSWATPPALRHSVSTGNTRRSTSIRRISSVSAMQPPPPSTKTPIPVSHTNHAHVPEVPRLPTSHSAPPTAWTQQGRNRANSLPSAPN